MLTSHSRIRYGIRFLTTEWATIMLSIRSIEEKTASSKEVDIRCVKSHHM